MPFGYLKDDEDPWYDPYYSQYVSGLRPPRVLVGGRPEVKRAVLQELAPERRDPVTRLLSGLAGDVSEYASGVGALAVRGFKAAAYHPLDTAKWLADVLPRPLLEDPQDTIDKTKAIASFVAQPYIEAYTPREGESVPAMITRRILDHPFDSLMDVAGVLSLGSATVGKAGFAAASKNLAATARALDPISLSLRTGKALLARTPAAGTAARLIRRGEMFNYWNERQTRHAAASSMFNRDLHALYETLDAKNKALFFPMVEGRVHILPGQEGAEQLTNAFNEHLKIRDKWEKQLGMHPEQVAQEAADAVWARLEARGEGGRALDPQKAQRALDTAYNKAYDSALAARVERSTVSTRSLLNEQRYKEWLAEVENTKAELANRGLAMDEASMPPEPPPATADEALQLMGPLGGTYFPHSGEVHTRDLATISNYITKVREAVPWRRNEGALFRTGNLADLDPELAMRTTNRIMEFRGSFQDFMNWAGEKWGTKLVKGAKIGTDPDFRAGTHHMLWPNGKMQLYSLSNEAERLYGQLAKHENIPEVANLNFADVIEKMTNRIQKSFGIKRGVGYKVPSDVLNELSAFFETFKPTTNPIVKALDRTGDAWRFVTLNMRPQWVLNNVIGNVIFNTMYGVTPMDYVLARRNLSKLRELPYVSGGLWKAEAGRNTERYLYAPERGTGIEAIFGAARLPAVGKAVGTAVRGAARGLGKYGESIAEFNSFVEDFFRSAAYVHGIRRLGPKEAMKRAGHAALSITEFGEKLDELSKMGIDVLDRPEHLAAVKMVNRFLNDYQKQGPIARRIFRRVIPFQSFYRHSAELLTRYPFEYPMRGQALRTLGKWAIEDIKQDIETWGVDWDQVPAWLRDSVPIYKITGANGEQSLAMLSSRGPNPFSVLAGAGQEALGLASLHPLIKTAIEGVTGVDLFTMEPFTDPLTTFTGKRLDPTTGALVSGKVAPNLFENIGRQFWPYSMARQLLARGRIPFGTTTLWEQLANAPGSYRTDIRGREVRRPYFGVEPILRPFAPQPQFLEQPTRAQVTATEREYSALLNRLARSYPELRPRIRELMRERAREIPRKRRRYRRE